MLRSISTAILLIGLSAPIHAEQQDDLEKGLDLLSEATRLMFEGLLHEMEPKLRALEGFAGDLGAYHLPEILPNGDIIIRRKTPLETGENEEIDL